MSSPSATIAPAARYAGRRLGPPIWLAGVVPATLAAVTAGLAAEWLDFRALRYPLLAGVLLGVVATSASLDLASGRRRTAIALLLGPATWAGAQTIYAVIHAARGESFDFGAWPWEAQASQAVGLIIAHAIFLGVPTGAVSATVLALANWYRRGDRLRSA